MSTGNPLGPVADGARNAEQTLCRAIAAAGEQWKDSARRSFDVQYLEPIQADARRMTASLAEMAERLRGAAGLLNG